MTDSGSKVARRPGRRPLYGDEGMVVASLRLTDAEEAIFQSKGAQWFRDAIDSAEDPEPRSALVRKRYSVKTTAEQREKLKRLGSDWTSRLLSDASRVGDA